MVVSLVLLLAVASMARPAMVRLRPTVFFFLSSLLTSRSFLSQVSPLMSSSNPTGRLVRSSGQSKLFHLDGTGYAVPPMLVKLRGSRTQIGYDYAALLHGESSAAMTAFLESMFSKTEQEVLLMFLEFCWDRFLVADTPGYFVEELSGMAQYHAAHPTVGELPTDFVARVFYTIANMPADPANIVAMLEQELEPASWPWWLREGINDIIAILEKIKWGCDAYGVWGSRTVHGQLFSSRNLDWNSNTGLDAYKLVIHIEVDNVPAYATLGFSVGLGALAGQSSQGITTSEMNLDNSVVTFAGAPFPLRLRMVLEGATDLASAMRIWNSTNNTNSFNFLIASAADGSALALETIMGFTQQYGANSPVEAAAVYQCPGNSCRGWTNQTGAVRIGAPLPECVFRSNHAFSPVVMRTQEPLFNDTVFRYALQHDLFAQLTGSPIDDQTAVSIVATLGTKGVNFLSCDPSNFARGENVMSVAYMPGARTSPVASAKGYLYVAWEQGKGSAKPWSPAACNNYIRISFDDVAQW